MENKKQRFPLLDSLRGFAIFNVVIYHFLYDLYVIYGFNPNWPDMEVISWWQKLGSGLFILISGMVFQMNHKYLLQGLKLNLLGLAITLLTAWLMPKEAIYYGILTFFGCALWLMGLLKPALQKMPPVWGLFSSAALYLLTVEIGSGYASVFDIRLWQWPVSLYCDELALLGFKSSSFHSADYFPLLPNFFVMVFGWFSFSVLRQKQLLHWLTAGDIKIFTLPGRHSLLIYLLHQPVLLLLCRIVFGY